MINSDMEAIDLLNDWFNTSGDSTECLACGKPVVRRAMMHSRTGKIHLFYPASHVGDCFEKLMEESVDE